MKIKLFIIVLLWSLVLHMQAAYSQVENRVFISPVESGLGKDISIPVYMTNTDEIVAVQLQVRFPEGLSVMNVAEMSDRKDNHTIAVKALGNNEYLYAIYSVTNKPLRGNSGILFRLSAKLPEDWEVNSIHSMAFVTTILSKINGDNVVTSSDAGNIKVISDPRPDIAVQDIRISEKDVAPDGKINVSWVVKNVGDKQTSAGWSEQPTLVADNGEQMSLGSLYYDQLLSAGGTVSRQAEFVIPELPGIDGKVRVAVKLTPNPDLGELPVAQNNNTDQSTAYLTVSRKLKLELPLKAIDENYSSPVGCKLFRSGSWMADQTFSLKSGDPTRLTVPVDVTIPAGQSGVVFYVNLIDNNVLDMDSTVTVTVEGNGYDPVEGKVWIEDNEVPSLTVRSSLSEVNEGDEFTLTIERQVASSSPLAVYLSNDHAKRFEYPSQAIIPAGEKSVIVKVTAVNDNLPDVVISAEFTVTAAKHTDGKCIVILNDDDVPEISLSITPVTISESAGPLAIVAILKRLSHTESNITVRFSDDSQGDLYYANSSITLAEGVEEARFTIGVIDNAKVDGDRVVNITAAVYISSCSCSASGTNAGVVNTKLTILDDDGPALKLTSSQNMLLEGKEDAAMLTISRNTDTSQSLTVSLSSDRDEELIFDKMVTIPAGAVSVQVPVSATANETTEGDRTVTFTVAAEGYTQGVCWAMITDQTLPDAVISGFNLSSAEIEAQSKVEAKVTVTNHGAIALPSQTKINLYLSNSSEVLATLYTQTAIAAGASETVTKNIQLPNLTGEYTLTAKVNEAQSVKELLYLNNTSEPFILKLLPKYTVRIETDKSVYGQGEAVIIKGIVTGSVNSNVEVDVYVVNSGYRKVIKATTNAQGSIELTYQPESWQMGHFIAGACYPDENLNEEQVAFDIYGLKRESSSYITCETLVGEPHNGEIALLNPGVLKLTEVEIETLSIPDNCEIHFEPIASIAANEKVNLKYTITGSAVSEGNDWEEIKALVKTKEGATLDLLLYYYCRSPKGQLQAGISSINTTMIKGASRDYQFTLTNIGKGETGKITIALPNNAAWLSLVTPKEMASLKAGESTTIILRMIPTDDLALNVPVTGQLGINCANGSGIPLNFSIEPVSESTGTLVVDVCDENTYNTVEAPHVANAKVIIKHPITGAIISEGISNVDGLFTVNDLPEGYYSIEVSAEMHNTYRNNILINPGTETIERAFICFQAITTSFDVVETDVEDEYKIVTTVQYATNIPAPVVEIKYPDEIPYKNQIFNIVATNKGLLPAYDVEIELPASRNGMTFEVLGNNIIERLDPQSSTVITVKVTVDDNYNYGGGSSFITTGGTSSSNENNSGGSSTSDKGWGGNGNETGNGGGSGTNPDEGGNIGLPDGCFTKTITVHWKIRLCDHKTGEWVIVKGHVSRTYQYGNCPSHPTMISIIGGGGGGGTGGLLPPGGGSGSGSFGSNSGSVVPVRNYKNCDPCISNLIKKMWDCGKQWIPIIGCAEETIEKFEKNDQYKIVDAAACLFEPIPLVGCTLASGKCMHQAFVNGGLTEKQKEDCIYGGLVGCGSELVQKLSILGWIPKIQKCWDLFKEPCKSSKAQSSSLNNEKGTAPSFIEAFNEKTEPAMVEFGAMYNACIELFGNQNWLECPSGEWRKFYTYYEQIAPELLLESIEQLKLYKPEYISNDELFRFVERQYNTYLLNKGESVNSDNYIHKDILDSYVQIILEQEQIAENYGYASMAELFEKETTAFNDKLFESSSTVCASITLQFSQTMTLTRQAFEGTLTVFNGHETTAMKDVKLNLQVKDMQGKGTTENEFQINKESIDGFTGELNGAWTLDAHQNGTAKIKFIPTKFAAPDEPMEYSFGGTLSYLDPFTGLEVTRDLYPVVLTVKPSPNLELIYFVQRDVLGDDPLTKEVIEPMVPAEFSLLIHNVGKGEGKNIRMTTQQPEIIANEKGLAIDFELLSSQLNGEDKTLALGGSAATEFGNIPAGGTAYAQWWFTSTLLGHFVDYKVEATHVTSHGNPNLSLLDTVTVHELIRSLKVPVADNQVLTGFLVNDIVDADDLPDILYLSDGTSESVVVTTNVQCVSNAENQYMLTVTPAMEGWNYGVVSDPTNGRQELVSVTDVSNGTSIDLRNFWQTDRTLRDGKDPLNENRLHFADKFAVSAVKEYLLTFAPKPDVILEVESFVGVPIELVTLPVAEIKVRFNKPIDPSTFTADDLTINWQGDEQDASLVKITTTDNQEFTLELLKLTAGHSGYFTLAVQTAGITDEEGFIGETGKIIGWNQLVGGKVRLNVRVDPQEYGKVTLTPVAEDNLYDYQTVVTLKAEPEDGYDFIRWSRNGETLSTDAEYRYTVLSEKMIKAEFKARLYDVMVEEVTNGGTIVSNSGTGKYEYDTELELTAIPYFNYTFEGWYVNDALYESQEILRIKVNTDLRIKAVFKAIPVTPGETITFDLLSGWNWISVNVADVNLNNPISLFAPLAENLLAVRGQEGELSRTESTGLQGNLMAIDPNKSYKLKMEQAASLELKGIPFSSTDETITLDRGWNWVGYIPSVKQDLDDALSTLPAERNEVLKTQDGFAMYDGNRWLGSLNILTPGSGYLYHANSTKSFNYHSGTVGSEANNSYENPAGWVCDIHKYVDNMNVVAKLYESKKEVENGKFTIGAFVNGECRGISVEKNGYFFITVYGEALNEKVIFKAYDQDEATVLDISENTFFNNHILGNFDEPFSLNLIDPTDIETINDDNIFIYPSPVNDYLYIQGTIKDLKEIRILDTQGNVVYIDMKLPQEGINVSAFADGVYFISITTDSGVVLKKFVKTQFVK